MEVKIQAQEQKVEAKRVKTAASKELARQREVAIWLLICILAAATFAICTLLLMEALIAYASLFSGRPVDPWLLQYAHPTAIGSHDHLAQLLLKGALSAIGI